MPPEMFITTRQLEYRYRRSDGPPVLDRIDLALDRQTSTLIGGASGSGKSTLCRTFNGLIPHFYGGRLRGEVQTGGRPVVDQSVAQLFDQVGMVFQNPEAQLFCGSVEREMAYGLESLGLDRTTIRRRIAATAERMAIASLLPRAPHELSGGEKHLVTLAAILALEPAVLVLDEPYANLDARHVRRIRSILKSVHAAGTGIVICEHRLTPTLPDVDHMVVLQDGRVVADGAVQDVLRNDLKAWGLETPLPVKLGKQNGLQPLPLTVETLPAHLAIPDFFGLRTGRGKTHVDPGTPPVLEVEGLTARRGRRTLLDRIDFQARAGECLAIVGANGAGKTTLLRHIMGLERPSAGTIRIKNRNIKGRSVARLAADVGLAFQNPENQFFRLSVREEIETGPRALKKLDEGWIQTLIDRFRLTPCLERAPYRLSGGEKKRVAFASALAARPSILALDEPTAGQDYHFRRALVHLLEEVRAQGLLVILVTHDLAFAERCADRWLLMADSRILADGDPWKIMANREALSRAGLAPTDRFAVFSKYKQGAGHV
ncbi:MAG: energy-coupling factor ABC transporter ATP-binding protein [Desulfosarcina sp.]|nr:energy-coupling factor ABC transporter ATP-binding protein [Desulfobacterales bacterium]